MTPASSCPNILQPPIHHPLECQLPHDFFVTGILWLRINHTTKKSLGGEFFIYYRTHNDSHKLIQSPKCPKI